MKNSILVITLLVTFLGFSQQEKTDGVKEKKNLIQKKVDHRERLRQSLKEAALAFEKTKEYSDFMKKYKADLIMMEKHRKYLKDNLKLKPLNKK